MNLIRAARSFSGLTQAQFGEELARMGAVWALTPLKPVSRHRVCHWEREQRDVPAWAERTAVERLVNQWWETRQRCGFNYWRRRPNEPGDCDFARALQLPELAALYEARAALEEVDLARADHEALEAALASVLAAIEVKFQARWRREIPTVFFSRRR